MAHSKRYDLERIRMQNIDNCPTNNVDQVTSLTFREGENYDYFIKCSELGV